MEKVSGPRARRRWSNPWRGCQAGRGRGGTETPPEDSRRAAEVGTEHAPGAGGRAQPGTSPCRTASGVSTGGSSGPAPGPPVQQREEETVGLGRHGTAHGHGLKDAVAPQNLVMWLLPPAPRGQGDRQGGHSDAPRTELDSGRSVCRAPRREQPQPGGLWRRPGLPVTAAAWLIGRGGSGARAWDGNGKSQAWTIILQKEVKAPPDPEKNIYRSRI